MPLGAFRINSIAKKLEVGAPSQVYEIALGIGNRVDIYEFDNSDDSLTYSTTLNPNVGSVFSARINPAGTLMGVGGGAGDYFALYEKVGGVWTKQTKPTGAPTNVMTETVAWSNDGNYLGLTSYTEFAAYSVSGTTLTQLTINYDSAGLTNDRSQGLTISNDGVWWIVVDRFESAGGSVQGMVKFFKRTGTTLDFIQGIETGYRAQRVSINPNADTIWWSDEDSPDYVNIATRSGDVWTVQTLSTVLDNLPEEGRRDIAIDSTDTYTVMLFNVYNAPYGGVRLYKNDGDGTYSSVFDSATGAPFDQIFDTGWQGGQLHWTTNDDYLLIGAATNAGASIPILSIYQNNKDDTFTRVATLEQDSAAEDVLCVGVYPGYHA